MKKYATVPILVKLKRFFRACSRPCLKFRHDCSVGLCSDTGCEPLGEAKLKTESELRLIDLAKLIALLTLISVILSLVTGAVIAAIRHGSRDGD